MFYVTACAFTLCDILFRSIILHVVLTKCRPNVTRLAAPGELRCICVALQTTDDDRNQRPLLVWPSYTMCRRASNEVSVSY